MKEQLLEILDIPDTIGVLAFNADGRKVFQVFRDSDEQRLADDNHWEGLVQRLNGVAEADVLFDKVRLYFRKSANGVLLVLMENHAPAAMVRLSCDMILPAMRPASGFKLKAGRWIKSKFK